MHTSPGFAVATREEALRRLAEFVPRAGRAYAATRNEDRGPGDRSNVSTLSPYIRHRLVTEEEVLAAVLARHTRTAAFKFVQEIFWRTYWKGGLETRPALWDDYVRDVTDRAAEVGADGEARRNHERAVAGETGIAPFDAWARELVETGYLHNHARMWFASIWIFTLRLPWELGADFFMRHLRCGDPAANTLSWRWVAGLQTRGKTYLARAGNIERYTGGRVGVARGLATSAPALTGPAYAAQALPRFETESDARVAAVLLVHDDDLGVETFGPALGDVRATAAFETAAARSPHGVADGVRSFAADALADALARAPGRTWTPLDARDPAAAARTLISLAAACGARRIVAPYAPVGPTRTALRAIAGALREAKADVTLLEIARPYDAVAWPHAGRGFFGLAKAIPSILDARSLGVPPQ